MNNLKLILVRVVHWGPPGGMSPKFSSAAQNKSLSDVEKFCIASPRWNLWLAPGPITRGHNLLDL
jgi:hypothetical protein